MVFPEILTRLNPGHDWYGSINSYNWVRTDGIYEIYALNGTYADSEIAVNTDTGIWQDWHANPWPKDVTEYVGSDGLTYVKLSNDLYTELFLFAKPTEASWIPVSPPPNTNSYLDASVSYLVDDNELRVYIPLDKPSTVHPNPDPAGRDLYYQLRKVSGTSFFVRIVHNQGTATNETIVPTTAGIYQLEKVQSNPTSYTTYDTAEVTQAQLDFYATNNPPDDDPPEDDPPSSPVFVPPVFIRGSGRRGNLNFW